MDTGTSPSSTETPQLTVRILSQVLGICDTAREEICALVTGKDEVENKTKHHMGQLIDVFNELYQERLKTSKQDIITKFFQDNLGRQ